MMLCGPISWLTGVGVGMAALSWRASRTCLPMSENALRWVGHLNRLLADWRWRKHRIQSATRRSIVLSITAWLKRITSTAY